MADSPRAILLQTVVIIALRIIFFMFCRKLLLHNLYSDLRELSGDRPTTGASPPSTPTAVQHAIPLEDLLPAPSTQTQTKQSPSSSWLYSRASPHPLVSHSAIASSIFATCFSESLILFVLLMSQAFEIFDDTARLVHWNISLFFLIILIVVLVPFFVSLLVAMAAMRRADIRRLSSRSIGLSLIPVIAYIVLLSCIPLPPAVTNTNTNFITALLSRLVVVGIIILGILSGFGAVTNSWQFLPASMCSGSSNSNGGKEKKIPTERDVIALEESLRRVRHELSLKRMAMQVASSSSSTSTSTSWWSKTWWGYESEGAAELAALEMLEDDMACNLESLKQALENAKFAITLRGRLWTFGGKLFAAYCAVRIISAAVHLVSSTSSSSSSTSNAADLMTFWLTRLGSLLFSSSGEEISREKVAQISRSISLLLVGVIILTSLRLVLRGVTRALRVTNRSLSASVMLLLLAQLMGIYLLSTLTQLRTTFPPLTSSPSHLETSYDDPNGITPAEGNVTVHNTNLFSTLPEYQVFGKLFDSSFLLSAGVSFVWMWVSHRFSLRERE